MTDAAIAELLRSLDTLEQVQADLAAIASRTDDRRRHDLIDGRRKLSAQIAAVGRAASTVFASADPELEATYRQLWSKMRSAAALHQASWPAVRLGEDVEAYRASAQTVRAANRAFVAWTREAVKRMLSSRPA